MEERGQDNQASYPQHTHPETIEFWLSGELPEHMKKAQNAFRQLVNDDTWYSNHRDEYIAIYENDFIFAENYQALSEKKRLRYGNRPIFSSRITRKPPVMWLGPH